MSACRGGSSLAESHQPVRSLRRIAYRLDRVTGSVSTKEIAQAAKEQHGFDIDKKKLVLPEPIKSFGTHEVPLKLHPQVTATLRVKVIEQ